MTRVKICGIQRPEDAVVAAEAGADYIGLVFVTERRRRIETDTAKKIISALKTHSGEIPQVVGLFADQPIADVTTSAQACGLDAVQLCGDESLDDCNRVLAEAGIKVIKVLHVQGSGIDDLTPLSESVKKFTKAGHLVTLDRRVEGLQGGTGQTFDWDVAARLAQQGHEFFLAGGLAPDNVAQAVAQVNPWGVDVSSGVETDGDKDPDKIRAFVKNARRAGT